MAARSSRGAAPVRLLALGAILALLLIMRQRSGGSSSLSASDLEALCSSSCGASNGSAGGGSGIGGSRQATPSGLADGSGSGGAGGSPMKHIYVVGCGHSGTSLLKRSIAHLPGLYCIPKETWAYERMANKPEALQKTLAKWDHKARERGFDGWVEKTPSHVKYLGSIFERDPEAKVVFIVRDGRDVAASFIPRGFPWQDCMGRWVKDNTAALPYLDSRPDQLLVVRFEDFFSAGKVLGVMRQLAEFVGVAAAPERLLLALQPSTTPLHDDDQCFEYDGEDEKATDLAASYVSLLGNASALAAGDAAAAAGGVAPNQKDHKAFRSWQSSQAWAPQVPRWQERLDARQQADVAANKPMQQLLERFGYA